MNKKILSCLLSFLIYTNALASDEPTFKKGQLVHYVPTPFMSLVCSGVATVDSYAYEDLEKTAHNILYGIKPIKKDKDCTLEYLYSETELKLVNKKKEKNE